MLLQWPLGCGKYSVNRNKNKSVSRIVCSLKLFLLMLHHCMVHTLVAPSKPQPNTRAGPASWHNVVYTPSDSSPGMPGGHTQSTRAPPSASYHEYDLIDQGGATVCIKLNSDSRVKAPTSTGTAEEDYSTPADALTDGGFTAKKGCNHKYAELNAYPVKQ